MRVSQKLFIGTSGWSYPDWRGAVYPERRTAGFSELSYLADLFDAVEINTSFYRPPAPRMSESWVAKVDRNPRFRFTAKLWRRFTHERTQPWTGSEVAQFADSVRPLQEAGKLGAVLVQFPWSFSATAANRDWLARVADAFEELPLVVEVRHISWRAEEPLGFLRERRLGFCNIDQPHFPKNIGRTNIATGPTAYYRFHGRNKQAWFSKDAGRDERYNYLYNADELAPWADEIDSMRDDVNRIFVMTNNHYRGQAAVNALQLKARLTGDRVKVPQPLLDAYPALKPIAAPMPGQRFLDF